MEVVAAVAAVLIGWALLSARAARLSVTVPIVLMAAGALLAGGTNAPVTIEIAAPALRHVLEATLALLLFTDAVELHPAEVRQGGGLAARLLLIGFPLTVAAGYAAGLLLFPRAGGWVLATAAAALAATDSSLVAVLTGDERVPAELRTAINIESGLNDGLAAPLVLFFLAGAVAADYHHETGAVLGHTLGELAVALAVGAAIGAGCGRLLWLTRTRGWSATRSQRLAYPAVAALTFVTTNALHGNGLVAAFVAGLAVSAVDQHLPEEQIQLSQDLVVLLSAAVWFVFGSTLPTVLRHVTWEAVVYAVASLTVVRMLPVMLGLIGDDRPRREKLTIAWLGPAGLPSVVFALLAVEQLAGPAGTVVATLAATTVLLSIVLHGLSAVPIARRFGPKLAAHARRGPGKVPAA